MLRGLIADTLTWLQAEFPPHTNFLVSATSHAYFPRSQEVKKSPPPPPLPLPQMKKEVAPPVVVAAPPPPSPPVQKAPPPPPAPELASLIAQAAPHLQLRKAIPSDAVAKQLRNQWKEPAFQAIALVLSCGESGAELEFLQRLTRAIETSLFSCQLIDAAQCEVFLRQSTLKWIIAPQQTIENVTALKKIWRHLPNSDETFLEDKPLITLSPISAYLKDPGLKKFLWQKLCTLRSS